jgi:YidC/Oxa1 family membrane protein insertase
MDQKRLIVFFVISLAILLGFQQLQPKRPLPVPDAATQVTQNTPTGTTPRPAFDPAAPGTQPVAVAPPQRDVPRLAINAPRVQGSINLAGARLDDLVLRDYREAVSTSSPLVRLLEPRVDPQPYYAQFGWTGDAGVKVPDVDAVWTASGAALTPSQPITLSWDNGAGQVFEIALSVDGDYVFTAEQRVRNTAEAPVVVHPWSRIRRDYKPVTAGYYILHEGLLGFLNGKLQEQTYDTAKSEGDKLKGASLEQATTGGWAGITDKYWLTALIPDQAAPVLATFHHLLENNADRYQVGFVATNPLEVAPGATVASTTRLFAGAKEVHLLDRYEHDLGVPHLDKAVDFGWFYFLTKPIFYALDWLYQVTGNFGVAILIFTVFAKLVFFPLANYSYRSMSKMKLLAPKMTEIRERLKDSPQEMQAAIMKLYKTEAVNPASGCLPMLVQIPVFFSLYKVIFVTIEMRHAPFFGWIKDLSAVDPTNVFNLFGLIPFDPGQFSNLLHLGIWPLIMGVTMFLQQKLNPPPPDPVQAQLFQFMPIIFTFMLSSFPAGLVIYWSWNNTLTIAQQWTIMRRTRLSTKRVAANA